MSCCVSAYRNRSRIILKRKTRGFICKQQYEHLCFERCLHTIAAQTRFYSQSFTQPSGPNRKAPFPFAEQAELTALPAVHNTGKLNQHVSKLNTPEKHLRFPVPVRGKRPFLKNKGTKMDNKLLQRLFPLEEVTLFHFSEQYLHTSFLVFLCA